MCTEWQIITQNRFDVKWVKEVTCLLIRNINTALQRIKPSFHKPFLHARVAGKFHIKMDIVAAL